MTGVSLLGVVLAYFLRDHVLEERRARQRGMEERRAAAPIGVAGAADEAPAEFG
jgi:hypothetical protein